MDERTKRIFESIEKHKQEVLKHVENEKQILGIFLYGSQNYMLDTEESDVDTIAIILPTERELYFEKPVTKEIHLDNGEHIVMKDIREYIRMLKKQNLNFLEILFTKYSWINPKYKPTWDCFVIHKERLARYDNKKAIKSAIGQIENTLKQAAETIDNEKYSKALKMYFFLQKFSHRLLFPYEKIIIPSEMERQAILNYKTGKEKVTLGMIYDLAKSAKEYTNSYEYLYQEETEVLDFMIELLVHKLIKKGIFENPY